MTAATTAEQIRAAVAVLLSEWGVQFSARYTGETTRPGMGSDARGWKCDGWRVSLKRGPVEMQTDYFTGLGHRIAPVGPRPHPPYRPGTLAHEGYLKTFKPVPPVAADVLHSLILDAQALDVSFPDWCSEYGYSEDSITDLNVYRACCEVGKELRKVLNQPHQLAALREAVADL